MRVLAAAPLPVKLLLTGFVVFLVLAELCDWFITDDMPGSGYGTERPAQACLALSAACGVGLLLYSIWSF